MDDEQPALRKRNKRGFDAEENGAGKRSKKHQRQQRSQISLTSLPIELLYTIHLYAKNPNFVVVNRRFHTIFSTCPISIKAEYLLARWYEAYCFGFHPSIKSKSANDKAAPLPIKSKKTVPATPNSDLLENGSLPELTWSSRFLPVLPAKDFPYPLSNSFQRSADHYILDFCLQYPLCNSEVLSAVEDIVLSGKEFGNIVLASGLWKDDKGQLCTHQAFFEDEREHEEYIQPSHLMINLLPKRIFQRLDIQNDGAQESRSCVLDLGVGEGSADFRRVGSTIDEELARHLRSFGSGARPNTSLLILFLNVISLHVPTSPSFISATVPINGYEGLPLVKSVFAQSHFMIQLLLSLGAEPSRKEGLALYVAIRKGWLEGLEIMIERDEAKIAHWDAAIKGIRSWCHRREERRRHGNSKDDNDASHIQHQNGTAKEASLDEHPITLKKRRRLLDRAQPDSKMLKEAVKHNQWAIANYIRSKGVIPDLRTIKLIEMKQPQDLLIKKNSESPQKV